GEIGGAAECENQRVLPPPMQQLCVSASPALDGTIETATAPAPLGLEGRDAAVDPRRQGGGRARACVINHQECLARVAIRTSTEDAVQRAARSISPLPALKNMKHGEPTQDSVSQTTQAGAGGSSEVGHHRWRRRKSLKAEPVAIAVRW